MGARARTSREQSLSAVLTESLAERRRLAALREVVAWMTIIRDAAFPAVRVRRVG